MAKKKAFDPYATPSIQRVRDLYVEHMRKLISEQGVSSIDELHLPPEVQRAHDILSPFWREAVTAG